jgi:acyl-CoA thioesterase-1
MKSPILYRLLLVFLLSLPISANAAEIKIVALGASQTYGKGATRADTYPAQLESLLKAEGYSVSVANEGVNGDTTQGILSRLDRAVPDGTKIVILQPGTNDRVSTKKRGSLSPEQTLENVEQMLSKLKERDIKTILLGYPGGGGGPIAKKYSAIWYGQANKDISAEMIQFDGQHFTKEGYAVLAKELSILIKGEIDKLPK